MRKNYKKLLFDLDNTLVDDDENRKYAINKILLKKQNIVTNEQIDKFIELDNQFWKDRAEGKIKLTDKIKTNEEKTDWLRAQRFINFFKDITLEEGVLINNEYINYLKEKIIPINNSENILKYLYEKKYEIYIITNGPVKVVNDKLDKINVRQYIKDTFAAEEAGYMKPRKEFFEKFFYKINCCKKDDMLIIGDELEKDVLGGIKNGIDTCWFNPKRLCNNQYKVTYEINNLLELKNIL